MITALALATLTLTAACSSEDGEDEAQQSPSPTTAPATSTVSAEEEQARKDVIAAYQGMTEEQVKAYAKASLTGSEITKYATGKALRDVKDAVFVNLQNDIIFKGEPKVTAVEDDVDLNLNSTPKQATLQVCFDMHTWDPVNKKTGKSVAPPDQAKVKPYVITAHLQNRSDQWQLTDEAANKDRAC